MDFAFADTMEADRQDRACSLLISLSLLADTAKRRAACNGNSHVGLLYQRELHYFLLAGKIFLPCDAPFRVILKRSGLFCFMAVNYD